MRFCTMSVGSGANEPGDGQGYSPTSMPSMRDIEAAAGVGAPQKYHMSPDVFWMSTKLALLPELGATVALMSCARTTPAIPRRPARSTYLQRLWAVGPDCLRPPQSVVKNFVIITLEIRCICVLISCFIVFFVRGRVGSRGNLENFLRPEEASLRSLLEQVATSWPSPCADHLPRNRGFPAHCSAPRRAAASICAHDGARQTCSTPLALIVPSKFPSGEKRV